MELWELAGGAEVAEERAGPDTGQEVTGGGIDPVAAAVALGGASREEADAFFVNSVPSPLSKSITCTSKSPISTLAFGRSD
jgi:hypothetical protein